MAFRFSLLFNRLAAEPRSGDRYGKTGRLLGNPSPPGEIRECGLRPACVSAPASPVDKPDSGVFFPPETLADPAHADPPVPFGCAPGGERIRPSCERSLEGPLGAMLLTEPMASASRPELARGAAVALFRTNEERLDATRR